MSVSYSQVTLLRGALEQEKERACQDKNARTDDVWQDRPAVGKQHQCDENAGDQQGYPDNSSDHSSLLVG
jgi:hypothetical protein